MNGRIRDWPKKFVKGLWENSAVILFVLVAVAMAQYRLGYNHMIGSFFLIALVDYNRRLWFGRADVSDLLLMLTFFILSVWMISSGTADIVVYTVLAVFAAMAAANILAILRRQPHTFRDSSRVAENYLDTGLRALVGIAGVWMSLAWMPEPRYLAGPFLLALIFRLAYPLRRVIYPAVLRLVGLTPTEGRLAPVSRRSLAATRRRKLAVLAVSLLLFAFVGTRLVFTPLGYDVSIPAVYTVPRGPLLLRKAELEPYVASPAGSRDPAALAELGFVLHALGIDSAPGDSWDTPVPLGTLRTNRAYLTRAEKLLTRALELDPHNAHALAWHGDTMATFAIDEGDPVQRMRFIEIGLAEASRAVEMVPDDAVVRLSRIDICLGLPRFVGRLPTAQKDVEYLLALSKTHPQATEGVLASIHQRAGDLYEAMGDRNLARTHWETALGLFPPDSEDYKTVAAKLLVAAPKALRVASRILNSEE